MHWGTLGPEVWLQDWGIKVFGELLLGTGGLKDLETAIQRTWRLGDLVTIRLGEWETPRKAGAETCRLTDYHIWIVGYWDLHRIPHCQTGIHWHWDTGRTFPGFSWDFLRHFSVTFSGLCTDFLRFFSRHNKDFLRTFQGFSQDFFKPFLRVYRESLRTFSGVSEDFFRTF